MCLQKGTGRNGKDLRFKWDTGNHPCLYGLWRLGELLKRTQTQDGAEAVALGGMEAGKYVILVEGESDCHSLWSAGLPAFGLPGAGNYKPERDDRWLDLFREIYVVIERDNGGKQLYSKLKSGIIASKLRFFTVPGFKDSSAAWCGCDTTDDFLEVMRNGMAAAVPFSDFVPPQEWQTEDELTADGEADGEEPEGKGDRRAMTSAENGKLGGRPKTDVVGAATAYADFQKVGGVYVLRHWREGWWRWNGVKYQSIMDSDLEADVMSFLQQPEVAEQYGVQPTRNGLHNMLSNLRSNGYCAVSSKVDNNTWLSSGESGAHFAAFSNAIVDIMAAADYQLALEECDGVADESEFGQFMRPLSPDFLATTAHDYPYDPFASCPKFHAFLQDVAPNPNIQEMLQQMFGACLVVIPFDKFWLVFGEAGTGKSTCLRILKMVVSHDNCCAVALLDLAEKFRLWPLAEKLANVVEEMSADDPLGKMRYIEGDFKNQITGGYITVERKGKDVTMAKCIAKHIFATNSLPTFFDKSSGIWDRMIILPFFERIRDTKKQVMGFEETLRDELPGILNWALCGLAKIRRNGGRIIECQECLQLKQEHRDRCDQDGLFIRENFYLNENGEVTLAKAYDAFCNYMSQQGLARRSSVTFQMAMQRVLGVKPQPRSKADRQRVFRGVSMLFNQPTDAL